MRHTIGTMVQALVESAWLHSRRQLRTASARINRTKAPLLGRPPINSPFPCCSSPLCLHPAWHPPCFGLWVIAWPGHRFAPLEIHVAAGTIRGTNFVRARAKSALARARYQIGRATRSGRWWQSGARQTSRYGGRIILVADAEASGRGPHSKGKHPSAQSWRSPTT